jgi:hypothetical protein
MLLTPEVHPAATPAADKLQATTARKTCSAGRLLWSVDDRDIQSAATMTLWGLKDVEGLHDIAKKHPKEDMRRAADRWIAMIEEKRKKARQQ